MDNRSPRKTRLAATVSGLVMLFAAVTLPGTAAADTPTTGGTSAVAAAVPRPIWLGRPITPPVRIHPIFTPGPIIIPGPIPRPVNQIECLGCLTGNG